jgi:fructose-1-phosphate kinase PfkB-like protein
MKDRYFLVVDPAPAVLELESWIKDERQADWQLDRKRDVSEDISHQLGGSDILELIISAGGVGAFFRSLNNWIKYRQPQAKVTIKVPDGTSVTIDSKSAGDVDEIMKALRGPENES